MGMMSMKFCKSLGEGNSIWTRNFERSGRGANIIFDVGWIFSKEILKDGRCVVNREGRRTFGSMYFVFWFDENEDDDGDVCWWIGVLNFLLMRVRTSSGGLRAKLMINFVWTDAATSSFEGTESKIR